MRFASVTRSGGQRFLALCAVVSIILSLMAMGAGPAFGDAPPSGPDEITVDGVDYDATHKSGPVSHFETPNVTTETEVSTSRNTWDGHGSEHLPCENGIHWVDNTQLLTISNCLDGDGETEPEVENVTAVAPDISLSEECGVEGTLTIPDTEGVVYLLNEGVIAAGVHSGPLSGTLTAQAASEAYVLVNPEFSVAIDIPAAEVCEEEPETGTLQIKKHSNDDPEAVFNFTGPEGLEFSLSHGESFFLEVELGVPHTFTEIVPDGWRLEGIDCDDNDDDDGFATIDLENNSVTMTVTDSGSPFKCDFDNELGVIEQPRTGLLQIKKHSSDDPEAVFNFTGPEGLEFSLSDQESFFFEAELGVPHTFTEIVPDGWRLEDIDCGDNDDDDGFATIDLENNSVTMTVTDPGSPFKCDFDNEQQPEQEVETGNIVIVKEVSEGSDSEQEFTFVAGGFTLDDDTLADGDQVSTEVEVGVYSVSELLPQGWDLLSAVCDSTDETDGSTPDVIVVSEDETVTCTFTNVEVEVSPEILPEIAVTKTPDVQRASPGNVVTFTFVISNPSATEPVRIVSIVDSVFGPLMGDGDCMVGITLEADTSCEFIFTWEVTEDDLGTHRNVVEVIGVDVDRPGVGAEAEAEAVVEVVEVGGIVITPPDQPAGPVTPVPGDVDVEAEELPFTGMDNERLLGLAIMLLGTGVLLLRWTPPREVDIIIEE